MNNQHANEYRKYIKENFLKSEGNKITDNELLELMFLMLNIKKNYIEYYNSCKLNLAQLIMLEYENLRSIPDFPQILSIQLEVIKNITIRILKHRVYSKKKIYFSYGNNFVSILKYLSDTLKSKSLQPCF